MADMAEEYAAVDQSTTLPITEPSLGSHDVLTALLRDGARRVAFVAVRDGQRQIHVVDRDGRHVGQVTDGPFGAWGPQFAPDGRLAYLLYRDPEGKRRRADLVIDDGTKPTVAVKDTVFAGYAWSPDGKSIAFGKPNALVFHELGSGAERTVALTDIDRRLESHAVAWLNWSPDGRWPAA